MVSTIFGHGEELDGKSEGVRLCRQAAVHGEC